MHAKPGSFMKVVLFVALVLGAFAYLARQIPQQVSYPPSEEKFDAAKIKTKDDLVQVGQTIFFGKGQCALCHTLGREEGGRCPNLNGIGGKLTRAFERESYIEPKRFIYQDYEMDGAPKPFPAEMPPINKPPIGLTEAEMLVTQAFMESQGGDVTIEPAEVLAVAGRAAVAPSQSTATLSRPGDAGRGQQVFARLGCTGCHGLGQAGPRGVDLLPTVLSHEDAYLRRMILEPGKSGVHARFDEKMTVRELNDLLAFLFSLPGTPPGAAR